MILGLNCLSLLFTTTYEIQGLLLGQTPRKNSSIPSNSKEIGALELNT